MEVVRSHLIKRVMASEQQLTMLCRDLVRIDSQNPPGDTNAIASFIERWIGEREGIEVRRVTAREPVVNLIVRMQCGRGGRRLILNAHMDTFPIGHEGDWSVPPLEAVIRKNCIFGRGISDMKAGLASALMALDLLYEVRNDLSGELVLTLVGDEETGGLLGTKYLLDNEPEARGDAMLNADAGSPRVVRFGEKGQMWGNLVATGQSAHGAHVHLGVNAIDRLIDGIARIKATTARDCAIPEPILATIRAATPVSGDAEREILENFTVNVGTIQGGSAVNMVPSDAMAQLDLRFPPGYSVPEVIELVEEALEGIDGVKFFPNSSCEPNWTEPTNEIVQLTITNSAKGARESAVANMRIGFSDARYYRQKGIPSVVYGPTPYNMGGVDEHITIEDLRAVFYVHTLTAFDYLYAK